MAIGNYVLITPAKNEESLIEKTLQSVISQTVRPRKWLVVNDCSEDRTEEIVRSYARQHPFIGLLNLSRERKGRSWAAQVEAIRAGYKALGNLEYGWIGNLDADISLPVDYYERIMEKFNANPALGLAGGFIHENAAGSFRSRRYNHPQSVPHAIQFFRKQCYEDVGGYLPLKYGGPDWYAEVTARMKGWQTESYPDIKAFHHRNTGEAEGILNAKFRLGLMDYALGSHPLFEVFKCVYRLGEKPYLISAAFRMAGFVWLAIRRDARPVSTEFVDFLRREQKRRLAKYFKIIHRGNGNGHSPRT